jgi:hypothetical protein
MVKLKLTKPIPALVFCVPLIVFTLLCAACLRADVVQTGTIDFRQGANLKMIFDGGLRPYRLQGLESRCCVFDNAVLSIILPNCSPVTFPANSASIDVLAGNEIDSMDLFGEYMDVRQAVALTDVVCNAWHLPTTGLDDVAANLGTMPGDSRGWGTELDQPGLRAHISFKPIYLDHVKAYVNLSFRCGTYAHLMEFLTKPIEPPAGYENVSMDPRPFKPSSHPIPAMSFEEARAKFQARLKEELGTNQTLPPQPPPQLAPAPAVKRETSPWPVALLILAAVTSLLVWIRSRRNR